MDDRTGRIYTDDEVQRMAEADRAHMRPMKLEPTERQAKKMKVGRNDPCPCGSGKKFKKCCLIVLPTAIAMGAAALEKQRDELQRQLEELKCENATLAWQNQVIREQYERDAATKSS